MTHSFDERDRRSVLQDLGSADEEVRRLAVERIDALDEAEILPRLVERLGDADWRVRKAAVQRVVARPDPDAAARSLISLLGDAENSGRRNSAVEALVSLGQAALPALAAASVDPDQDVRKFAIDAMAGIGSERALDALIGCLEDPDPNVRAAVADALGSIGGPAARRKLREAAIDAGQHPLVRFSALHALDALEEPMRADELSSVLGDPMLGPPGLALLGRCENDPGAIDALAKGLANGARTAREAAMRAVVRLAAGFDSAGAAELVERVTAVAESTPQLMSQAVERLGSADLSTQLTLVQFLGLVGAEAAVVPILEAGRDEALAAVALDTLEAMGPTAVETLDACWSELGPDRRRDACAVLGRCGGSRAVERLVSTLEDSEPAPRAAAAQALGALGVEQALVPLVRRIEQAASSDDLDGEAERVAITGAIIRLAGPRTDGSAPPLAARAVELLAGSLAGASEAARLCIARILGCIARPEDAELVCLLLKNPSAEVRRAAVDAIARLEPDRAPEPLHLAVGDESAGVRMAAARALGESSRESVFEDLGRLAEDDDVRVRAMAVCALGRKFSSAAHPSTRVAALAVMARACEDEVPVALAVVEAATEAGGDAVIYVAPLLSRREPEVVREAVRCFGRHAELDQLDALLPLVSHASWAVRAEAIEVLSQRRVRQAAAVIMRRLETEQDDFVRSVILTALDRLEG